jgi:hypothetical protein
MKHVKKYCRENPEWMALVVSILAGIPLAIWAAHLFFVHFDKPWTSSHRDNVACELLFVSCFYSVFIPICHYVLLTGKIISNRFKKSN